jgi:Skp family chaperone for outer membrane proteins|tara:strand:- start:1298 stop:1951 length:654 start_codon:yes stop_codon:yes gene_type:complete
MSDEIMATEAETETAAVQTQDKMFTQAELDKVVAGRLERETRKFEKKLGDINLDEARQVLKERDDASLQAQKERGEFESILKETVSKKDQEINAYKTRLHQTLVDGALLNAASTNNAINPDQVSTLLKHHVRLAEDGTVEITDSNNAPRYNDKGDLLSVNEAVSEFLTANPHFMRASAGGSGSQGNTGGSVQKTMTYQDMVDTWENGGREAYSATQR